MKIQICQGKLYRGSFTPIYHDYIAVSILHHLRNSTVFPLGYARGLFHRIISDSITFCENLVTFLNTIIVSLLQFLTVADLCHILSFAISWRWRKTLSPRNNEKTKTIVTSPRKNEHYRYFIPSPRNNEKRGLSLIPGKRTK